jgi:hypothetical protein
MNNDTFEANLKTLANAIELAANVINSVTGEAISTTLNGEVLSSVQLKQAIVAKMQSNLQLGEGVY